jgi:diguanylate cyclase (GGDEF)-like protein/PAS domain S-box-containing protein
MAHSQMKHSDSGSTRDDVLLRQLNLLYEYSRAPQWLILIASGAIAALVWDIAPRAVLLSWLTVMLALTIARSRLTYRFNRASSTDRLRLRWRSLFYLGNFLTGLALGSVHILLVPPDAFAIQAPAYGLAGGISLCVGLLHAHRYLAFVSFAVPAWVPPILYLLTQNDSTSPYWALLGSLIFIAILLAGAFINRSVLRTLQAVDHSNALVDRLEEARSQAESLNQQLTREIQHRRQAEQQLRESHDELEQRVQRRTAELQAATEALRSSEDQLSMALEASELGLWDWDLESDRVYHSHLQEIFGLPADAVPSMLADLKPLLHPDDKPRVREALIRHLRDQQELYRIDYRVKHADGRWVWVEDSGRAVSRDVDGRVLRMIGTRRDITKRQHRAEEARLAATVFEATSEGIFILDPQLRILAANRAMSVITGYPVQDVIGRPIIDIEEAERNEEFRAIRRKLETDERWQGERIATRRSGETYPQWLQLTVVRDEQGHITHYVGFFADLTIHRQTEAQLQYLTNFDPLTQLANRGRFTERLNELIGKARRTDTPLALLHIDLDRFKYINETLGHSVADTLLQEVASRLDRLFPNCAGLARLSADEFVLLLDSDVDHPALSKAAGKILRAIRQPMVVGENELVVTGSIGVSHFPGTARDSLMLITQANLAMQQAKYLGGDGFQFFTEALQGHNPDRLRLEGQLRKALDDQQMVVFYQPKLHITTDLISSAEALVRWQHPERGLVMPGDFIRIAEESGLMVLLGETVLRQACAQASRWYWNGPTPVCVSVNLSVQQLRQKDFAQLVEQVLEENNLPPELLELELTESMFLEDTLVVSDNIAALQSMGIKLAVDDFGTGYSSLAYLKRFPLDTLKIDRSFIAELHDGAQDAAIVRAIIAMAHSLELNVVAEGVEEDSQLELLREWGCDDVQGYLISRPVNADDFTELLVRAQPTLNLL